MSFATFSFTSPEVVRRFQFLGPLVVSLYYGFWDYSVPTPGPEVFDDWTGIYTYRFYFESSPFFFNG